jgi:hypothetical protein
MIKSKTLLIDLFFVVLLLCVISLSSCSLPLTKKLADVEVKSDIESNIQGLDLSNKIDAGRDYIVSNSDDLMMYISGGLFGIIILLIKKLYSTNRKYNKAIRELNIEKEKDNYLLIATAMLIQPTEKEKFEKIINERKAYFMKKNKSWWQVWK